MIQNKQCEIKYFDKWVKQYEKFEMYPEEEYNRIFDECEILKEKENSLLLDLGCGTGSFAKRLSKKYKVVGIDISSEEIKVASKNSNSEQYIIGDIEKLPFKRNSFDIVFIGGVLHHCPQILNSVIKEISSILKKGGRVFMLEPHALNPHNIYSFHFSTDPTENEKALLPLKIKRILRKNKIINFHWRDIGDITHHHPKDYKTPCKLERTFMFRIFNLPALACLVALEKLHLIKYFPGLFFVAKGTKK